MLAKISNELKTMVVFSEFAIPTSKIVSENQSRVKKWWLFFRDSQFRPTKTPARTKHEPKSGGCFSEIRDFAQQIMST